MVRCIRSKQGLDWIKQMSAFPLRQWDQPTAWAVTLVLFLVCVAARFALAAWLEQATFMIFVPAIVLGTFLYGYKHGLFLLGAFGLVTAYAFMPPTFTFFLYSGSIIQLAIYSASGMSIVLLIANLAASIRSNHEANVRDALFVQTVTDYATFMINPDGYVTNWNAGAVRIKGYKAEEILGKHLSHFYTLEDREAGLPSKAIEIARSEGRHESEGWRVRKDGTRFWASAILDAIRDKNGTVIGYAKITRDLTERRAAQLELENSRQKLLQAQKMEAIGQLTAGLAHDFNNILMVVDGNAELLRARRHEPRDVRALDAIERASTRGARLTRQLLTFSRQQTLNPSVIDLSDRLPRLQEMLVGAFRGDIAVSFKVPATIWPIKVDGGELDLAVLNIAVNARDAMPHGGRLVISARNVTLPTDTTPVDLAGDFVALTLADNGEGISPENLVKVFEPFFTTKGVGQGTGLGLSQVYGFTKQAGGAATVESELRHGASITLYLPRSEAQKTIAHAVGGAEVLAGGSETVLIVEDDPEVAAISRTLLHELGYQTLMATDAHHALGVLASVSAIDLIFSDIMMPGMSGIEFALVVRQRYPHLGILLTTGYGGCAQEALRAGMPLISKPYHLDELGRRVHEALLQRGTCVPAKAAAKAPAPL
jgi:PAS domain S-box-containing protein